MWIAKMRIVMTSLTALKVLLDGLAKKRDLSIFILQPAPKLHNHKILIHHVVILSVNLSFNG